MMSPEFRRGSQWGQVAHRSVVFSTRTADSRTHPHGAFSASSQNGARRNNVGTAHRHVAALRLVLIIASIDDSVEGMFSMTGSRPDRDTNDVPVNGRTVYVGAVLALEPEVVFNAGIAMRLRCVGVI
jgi:hypothetical protein